MKKKIPKLRRAIVDFLTDEDAKVVEKKVAKVALTIGFIITAYYNILHNVRGSIFHSSHSSNWVHTNALRPEDNTYQHLGINFDNKEKTFTESYYGQTYSAKIQPKSTYEIHGHHVNHQDGDGGSS